MANLNTTQPSFSSGIISTELFSRIDFNKIATGLKQCENFVIRPAGGAQFRTGTKYISGIGYEASDGDSNVKLIPFQIDRDNGYCLEFTTNQMRVYHHGELVVLPDDKSRVYTLNTPFTDVSDLKYVQHKNKMYIVSSKVAPQVLTCGGRAVWGIKAMNFNPTLAAPTEVVINKESAKNGDIVVNFDRWQYAVSRVDSEDNESMPTYSNIISSDIDITNQNITIKITGESCHHYNVYRVKGGEFYLIYKLPYNGTTTTLKDISYALNESKSPIEKFTAFDSEKPQAVGIWNQRLILGNTNSNPNTIWGSRVGKFEDFTSTPQQLADEGFELTLADNTTDYIRSFVTLDNLIVFTASKVWRITGTSISNMNAFIESYTGISDLIPATTKKSVLYIDNSKDTVANFIYSYELNGYTGQNLDILCRSLMDGYSLKSVTFRDNPFSEFYAVRSDGTLLALTYLREENIYAWHKHTTQGKFIDICSVKSSGNDELYCVVARPISASVTRKYLYVEQFANYIGQNEGVDSAWHLDCAQRFGGTVVQYQSKKFVNTDTTTSTIKEVGNAYTEYFSLDQGLYEITLVGSGGGSSSAAGGRGALGKFRVQLPKGTYNIKLNNGGAGAGAYIRNNNAYAGADSIFEGNGIIATAGGGTGGHARRKGGEAGKSGIFSLVTSYDYTLLDSSGESRYVKESYYDNTLNGWGAGGDNAGLSDTSAGRAGKGGYIKIVKYSSGQREIDDPDGIFYTSLSAAQSYRPVVFTDKALTNGRSGIATKSDLDVKSPLTISGKLYYYKSSEVLNINNITGLDRFNGMKVGIVQNGNFYETNINNGTLIPPEDEGTVLIGLTYEGVIETIPAEQQYSNGGTSVGTMRKIYDGVLSYYRSRGLWYGVSYDKLYEVKPYPDFDYAGNIPLETGKLLLRVADGFSIEKTFFVVQKSPFPALVQSITLGSTYNGKA